MKFRKSRKQYRIFYYTSWSKHPFKTFWRKGKFRLNGADTRIEARKMARRFKRAYPYGFRIRVKKE